MERQAQSMKRRSRHAPLGHQAGFGVRLVDPAAWGSGLQTRFCGRKTFGGPDGQRRSLEKCFGHVFLAIGQHPAAAIQDVFAGSTLDLCRRARRWQASGDLRTNGDQGRIL